MITLMNWLRAIQPISTELGDRLEDVIRVKLIAKKDYILKTGQVCRNIYFVEKGLLRTFYFQGGKTISSAFTKENEICVSLESFYSQQYGMECIQAVDDTDLSYISYEHYQELNTNFPEFNAICRLLLERCHVAKEQRLKAMWMQSAGDRFKWIMDQQPDLVLRVPGKYLASYIGTTEGMLSNIKGRPRNRYK